MVVVNSGAYALGWWKTAVRMLVSDRTMGRMGAWLLWGQHGPESRMLEFELVKEHTEIWY